MTNRRAFLTSLMGLPLLPLALRSSGEPPTTVPVVLETHLQANKRHVIKIVLDDYRNNGPIRSVMLSDRALSGDEVAEMYACA